MKTNGTILRANFLHLRKEKHCSIRIILLYYVAKIKMRILYLGMTSWQSALASASSIRFDWFLKQINWLIITSKTLGIRMQLLSKYFGSFVLLYLYIYVTYWSCCVHIHKGQDNIFSFSLSVFGYMDRCLNAFTELLLGWSFLAILAAADLEISYRGVTYQA